jgi:hypothetical protein
MWEMKEYIISIEYILRNPRDKKKKKWYFRFIYACCESVIFV